MMALFLFGIIEYALLWYVGIYVFKRIWAFHTTRKMMWFCQILVLQKKL